MKSNPTELETEEYEKVESNLMVLGYQEHSAKIIGEANNVDDVLMALRTVINKTKQQTELDTFWTSVDNSVNFMLDNLGL